MIAVDIGNTSIHIAYFRKGKVIKTSKLTTSKATRTLLKKALHPKKNENIVACSVVPRVTQLIQKLTTPLYVVGQNIKVPIKSFYNTGEVGMDRLVGAFTAKQFFPQVRLILDFGTAITLDILSKQGAYQGGLILPGIGSTLEVFSHCAMLPKQIKFKKTRKLIPASTENSISKGLEQGFSLMINSLIKRYKNKLKIAKEEKVIITGGEAGVITPYLNFPFKYEPLLVLRGLEILSRKFTFPQAEKKI